jgi:hypothetical protein
MLARIIQDLQICGNSHFVHVHVFIIFFNLFVLHLFVNIKDLTSCLANGRRDAQVEKSRKGENCFDFLRKVSLLESKEEEVGSGTCLYLCYGTRPMLSSML